MQARVGGMKLIQKWKRLRSQMVLDRRWCRVRQDTVALPNGQILDDFFINLRPDVALVFPVTENQEIVFVRQYRHGIEEILIELPAGTFDPAIETAASAAARELTEETGYVAESLTSLATLYDNPVKDTNSVHLFLAENVQRQQDAQPDSTEDIQVMLIPIAEVMDAIAQGEIQVAGTVAAIFLGLRYLGN